MSEDIERTPIDLSALDPTRDAARFDDVVRSIARAAKESAPVYSGPLFETDDALDRVARWWPATLAAAALIIAVSIPRLIASSERRAPASAMDVLGIPPGLTDVLRSRETPSMSDLMSALTTNRGR